MLESYIYQTKNTIYISSKKNTIYTNFVKRKYYIYKYVSSWNGNTHTIK